MERNLDWLCLKKWRHISCLVHGPQRTSWWGALGANLRRVGPGSSPLGGQHSPLISVTIPSLGTFVCKEKVSGSICLWNNYFKHDYNTDFSSNTEEIYLAKAPFSPTKNYTNISLNTTGKRTRRENLMFGTQKENLKSKLNPNRKTPERRGQGAGHSPGLRAQREHGWAHRK